VPYGIPSEDKMSERGKPRVAPTGTAGTLALSPSDVADFGTKFDVQATPR